MAIRSASDGENTASLSSFPQHLPRLERESPSFHDLYVGLDRKTDPASDLLYRHLGALSDEERRCLSADAATVLSTTPAYPPPVRLLGHAVRAINAFLSGDWETVVAHSDGCVEAFDEGAAWEPAAAAALRDLAAVAPRPIAAQSGRPAGGEVDLAPVPPSAARTLGIVIEGSPPPAAACARILDAAYPDLARASIAFLSNLRDGKRQAVGASLVRPGVETECPDLVSQFAPDDSPDVRDMIGAAHLIADAIGRARAGHLSGSVQEHFIYFHDALYQAMEDSFYSHLRTLKAVDRFLAQEFDEVLILASSGIFLPALLSMARRHQQDRRVRVSILGVAPAALSSCRKAIADAPVAENAAKLPQTYGLGGFQAPVALFSDAHGPVRRAAPEGPESLGQIDPPIDLRRMSTAAEALRAANRDARPMGDPHRIAPGAVRDYGTIGAEPDEPWLCVVADLRDPSDGRLFDALLEHYLPRRKLLIIDQTGKNGAGSMQDFSMARCCRLLDGPALAAAQPLPNLGRRQPTGHILDAVWQEIDLLVSRQAFVRVMQALEGKIHRQILPHRLRMAATCLALFQGMRIDAVIAFPTWTADTRIAVQAARCLGIPSVGVQSGPDGMTQRHPIPNTDLCALPDSALQHSYQDRLGYPGARIALIGSLHRQQMAAESERRQGREARASMRQALFGDGAVDCPLVVFEAPRRATDGTFYRLHLVLTACASIPGCRVAILLDAAETRAIADRYVAAAAHAMPEGRVRIAGDVATASLLAASDLVIASTRTTALTAAGLDRRVCFLAFGLWPGPLPGLWPRDVGGMAVEIGGDMRREIGDLLGAPAGSHRLDAVRREFLAANPHLLAPGSAERLAGMIDSLPERPPSPVEPRFDGEGRQQPRGIQARRRGSLSLDDAGQFKIFALQHLLDALAGRAGSNPASFADLLATVRPSRVARIKAELEDALAGPQGQEDAAILLIAAHLARKDGDTPRMIEMVERAKSAPALSMIEPDRALAHLQLFNLYLPHSLTELQAQITGATPLAADANDPDVQHLLVLVDGRMAGDGLQDVVDRSFPRCDRVTVGVFGRIKQFDAMLQNEMRDQTARRYSVVDLMFDVSGNQMSAIQSSVGAAYILSDQIAERTIRGQPEALSRILAALREPFSLAIEDHYYNILRQLNAMSVLLDCHPADALLVMSEAGLVLPSIVAMAGRRYRRDRIHAMVSPTKSRNLPHLIRQFAAATAPRTAPAAAVPATRLAGFSPPLPAWSSSAGPVRPPLDGDAWPITSDAAYAERCAETAAAITDVRAFIDALPQTGLRGLLCQIPVLEYGRRSQGDEPWIMLATNSSDPILAALHDELIAHFGPTHRLLVIDHSNGRREGIEAAAEQRFTRALHVDVLLLQDILSNRALPDDLVPCEVDLSDLHRRVHLDAGIDIDGETLGNLLRQADADLFSKLLADYVWLALVVMAALRQRPSAKAVTGKTRLPAMRVVAQAARLMAVPTLEVQSVLDGRMVRSRAPNTDYFSALETWSRGYFAEFLGYPRDRLLLGGALRYDLTMERVESDDARRSIAGLRGTLFPDADSGPLVMFGTQPVEAAANLRCIEHLLLACAATPGVCVVVKTHPREGAARRLAYEQLGRKHYPADRLLVTSEIDTYHLIMAADLTVSQTSNILLEAGILGRRTLSLCFGEDPPAVDFEEMGVATVIKDPAQLPSTIHDLLTLPPGGHWFDARRHRFLNDNRQLVDRSYRNRLVRYVEMLD